MAASKIDDTLSADEVADGIAALSPVDWARIQKVSVLLTGCTEAAKILRQDALSRAYTRERKCPRNVTVARFLCEAMRSIIWSQRNSNAARAKTELEYATDPASEGLVAQMDPGPSADLASEEECERIRSAILNLFADDEVAQTVAEGIMEGLAGEELCELASIDKKTLATKHRLIRRRIDGAFPRGWHDGN